MNKVLIIDGRNLLWIVAHRYDDFEFGFLDLSLSLAESTKASTLMFCWDSKKSFRRIIRADYKKRDKLDPKMEVIRNEVHKWSDVLWKTILPSFGFQNNFLETGLEADDLIANIVFDLRLMDYEKLIVSDDKDMYQLLNTTTSMIKIRRKTTYTYHDFTGEYALSFPEKWAEVLALAGCKSDNVEGIRGIGVKKAIDFLNGSASAKTKVSIAMSQGTSGPVSFDENLRLVKLPFSRKQMPFHFGIADRKKFYSACEKHSLEKLIDRFDRITNAA